MVTRFFTSSSIYVQLYNMLSGLYPYWDSLEEAINSDRASIVDLVTNTQVGLAWRIALTACVAVQCMCSNINVA